MEGLKQGRTLALVAACGLLFLGLGCDGGTPATGATDGEELSFEVLRAPAPWGIGRGSFLIQTPADWQALDRGPEWGPFPPEPADLSEVTVVLYSLECHSGCRDGNFVSIDAAEAIGETLRVSGRWRYGCDHDGDCVIYDYAMISIPKRPLRTLEADVREFMPPPECR